MIKEYKKIMRSAIFLCRDNFKDLMIFSLINLLCSFILSWCALQRSIGIVSVVLLAVEFYISIVTECGIVFYCKKNSLSMKPTIRVAYKFAQRNIVRYFFLNIKVSMTIRLFMVVTVLLIGITTNLFFVVVLMLMILTIFYAKIILALPLFVDKGKKGGEITLAMEFAEGKMGLIALCTIPYVVTHIWLWIVTLIRSFEVAFSTNQYIILAAAYSVILLVVYPFAYVCLEVCLKSMERTQDDRINE